MAEGRWLRSELLAGLNEQTLNTADFHRILSLARRYRGPRRSDGLSAPPDSKVLARQMSDDLSCFRQLACSVGFPPFLIELALIDDESLQRVQESDQERVCTLLEYGSMPSVEGEPEFVSVLAAYEEFADDNRLLQSWHRATSRVVREDRRSIVGTAESYEYVYLWDQLCGPMLQSTLDLGNLGSNDCSLDRSDFVLVEAPKEHCPARIGLPVFYPFGERTSAELGQDNRLLERPPKIARKLLAHLVDTVTEQFGANGTNFLKDSLLVIIPFTRPSFCGSPELNMEERVFSLEKRRRGDRPGGGVFLLCRQDASVTHHDSQWSTRHDRIELDRRVRRFAMGTWWLMFQSAMIEARQERDNSREADLAQYSHLIAKSLRNVTTHVLNAASDAEGLATVPDSVLSELDQAQIEAKRLDEIGDIARASLLIKSGRVAMRELSLSLDKARLEKRVYDLITDAVCYSKNQGIQDPERRAQVKDVVFAFESTIREISVKTSDPYLLSLIGEVVKNAVEYGGYGDVNGFVFSVQLSMRNRYVLLRISNPIRDEKAKKALIENLLHRRLHLGLSHVELLAQVFGLPLPHFSVEGNDAVVSMAIGVAEPERSEVE